MVVIDPTFHDTVSMSSRVSVLTSSSSSSTKARRVSSGRGGAGNIVYSSELASDLQYEAEIIRRRRMERNLYVIPKVNTGRGGTGNIVASSAAQSIPFDKSLDPDDSYEQIVTQNNKKAQKVSSTGRGGAGNLSGGKIKERKGRRRASSIPASSSASSSGSSSGRHSSFNQIYLASSSLPTSSQLSNFSYSPTSPRHTSNSILSFVEPNPIQSPTSPVGDAPEGPPQKPRWWKFNRRQRDAQQNITPPGLPVHDFVIDVRILPEDADHSPLSEEEQPVPQIKSHPIQISVPDIMLPEEADEQDEPFNHSPLYEKDQRVPETRSRLEVEYSIEHYRPGGEEEQQVGHAQDSGEDDDEEAWQLEVLREAENEIDSFLEL
ncbi:hypothetical protein BU17DRAFT_86093 [Hysterangium stoloniferum]|nr:hypothetical protein BU17DRAFT_86093 [Hysterangium stoloniferum]